MPAGRLSRSSGSNRVAGFRILSRRSCATTRCSRSKGAPAAMLRSWALHAALAVCSRCDELFGAAVALHVGVNSGEVVVGRAREGGSFVTGDVVNVAARLEQVAAPGEILVGERAAAAAQGAFEFGEETVVAAKGKADGIASRKLVRA